MSAKKQLTNFGRLLEQYRNDRGLSQIALERLLVVNGYHISNSLVNKYESGTRRPPAEFIAKVSRCLELTEQQYQALIDTRLADEALNLYTEFQSAFERDDSPQISPSTKSSPKTKSISSVKKISVSRLLNVFLCHSSGDKSAVRNLYQQLLHDGFDPWFDKEALLPGQDWDQEIQKAVSHTDAVVVCLSRSSINKAGYVQKEIKLALDVADTQPENTIFLIPLKLEECEVPQRLHKWHWVNLFEEGGYERLIQSLRFRTKDLGITSD